MRLLTRKPVTPTAEEMAVNSRSKPAKLRAAEKI
jgi:16S rRNA C1402 N4-methylase RsmH